MLDHKLFTCDTCDENWTPHYEGPAMQNVYQLAELAGCLKPDDEDSYGAAWLDEVAWWAARLDGERQNAAEFMATSPPDWMVWKLYAELGGWKVAVYSQRVTTGQDMTDIARRALYHFALKLASAVVNYNGVKDD